MGEILVEQLDFYRCARSNFARWDFVRKKVSGVIAARLLASGRDDGRTSNRHSLTVGEAPIAINCIGMRGMIEARYDTYCRLGALGWDIGSEHAFGVSLGPR